MNIFFDFAQYFANIVKPGADCQLKPGIGGEFFGIPHWWKYLKGKGDSVGNCALDFKFPNDIWLVGLAIIDILLVVAGIVAVIMIIYSGVNYITSMGNAEKAVAARKKITSALIGLGVVIIAGAVVSFIGKSLGGT